MSRCFPFPPPGYERKHKVEDLDLLKEANRKVKKHKEKKDKDRKKDKAKEKDGGDEKHREKKERKSKHKDKKNKHRDKKDKEERGKEKETSSISEESTVAGKVNEQSQGKIRHPKEYIRNRSSSLFPSGKPLQRSLPSGTIEDSKFVLDLDRRIRDDEKRRGSQSPEEVALMGQGDEEEVAGRAPSRNSLAEDKRIDRKMDWKGPRHEDTLVQHITPTSKSNVERLPQPGDEQKSARLEDKTKFKEAANFNHQKDKLKDRGKGSHVKEKDKEKEKKQGEMSLKYEYNKKSEQVKLKDDGRNDLGDNIGSIRSTDVLKNSNGSAVNGENSRKRKDMDTNGFLHENNRPSKMRRSAPHQLENGRKLEGFETPMNLPHSNHLIHNSIRTDKKNQLVNGIIGAQKRLPSKQKSSAATLVGDQIAEAPMLPSCGPNHLNKMDKVPEMEDLIAALSRQPVHPDSKYLDKLLTVPKIGEWSEVDDQDWLFDSKRKSKVESAGIREDPPVWSEAVHIESVDICVLPYVIPY